MNKFSKITANCFVVLLLVGCIPYIQGGVSVHDDYLAYPEVNFGDEILGHMEIGVESNITDKITLIGYGRHTSALNIYEQGGGINEAGVAVRIYPFSQGQKLD